jgi:hypothetical protein
MRSAPMPAPQVVRRSTFFSAPSPAPLGLVKTSRRLSPHLRGPEAGTGILHAEPGEHAEAPTGAVVERPTLCPDGGGSPEGATPAAALPQAGLAPSEVGDGSRQPGPHNGSQAANGVGIDAGQAGPRGPDGFAPQAEGCAGVHARRQHLIAQIRRFEAEGASGYQAFVRRLNEAGECMPNGRGPWDGPQYKRFARQYGLPL